MEELNKVSKKRIKVSTPYGQGMIDDIWISDLGYVMVKVYFKKTRTWINFNMTTIGELLLKKDSPVVPI